MKKKHYIIVFIIYLLCLAGCGQSSQQKEEVNVEPPQYYEGTQFYSMPLEEGFFTLLGVSDTHFYYYIRAYGEEEGVITFYKHSLEKESSPTIMDLPVDDYLLQTSHIATNAAGRDVLYLLKVDMEDGEPTYSFAEFDEEGSLLEEIPLKKEMLQQDYPKALQRLQDGSFAVITRKNFYVMDSTGEPLYSISCPGEEYRGVVEISSEKLGVSYLEAEGKKCAGTPNGEADCSE